MSLSREDSNVIKGLAVILMIYHHCYRLLERIVDPGVVASPLSDAQLVNLGLFCKICVSLFCFVSGYGLAKSYRNKNTNNSLWVYKHFVSSSSGYWFVSIMSYIIVMGVFHVKNWKSWGGNWIERILSTIVDCLGLAKLFGSHSLNGTWWYMGAAICFILLFPLLYFCMDIFGEWLVFFVVILIPRLLQIGYPGSASVLGFLPVFTLAMIFARKSFFEKVNVFVTAKKYRKHLIIVLLVLVCLAMPILYCKIPIEVFWEFHYAFACLPYIGLVFFTKNVLKPLHIMFGFFGKHATNIWLVHTFFLYYLRAVVFYFKWWVIPPLVILILATATSAILELLKKGLQYNIFIDRMKSMCERSGPS